MCIDAHIQNEFSREERSSEDASNVASRISAAIKIDTLGFTPETARFNYWVVTGLPCAVGLLLGGRVL